MKIHWTDTAIDHLSGIYDYITLDVEEYAKRMVDRLTKRSEQIGNSPYSGRMVPEFEDKLMGLQKNLWVKARYKFLLMGLGNIIFHFSHSVNVI